MGTVWVRAALVPLLLFFGTGMAWATNASETALRQRAHEAAEAFRAGDFGKSIAIYEGLRREGVVSGPLLYNLGNAYYRAGRFAEAIASYKGAVNFLPRDGDLAANLDYARKQRVDSLEEKPGVASLVFFWLGWASPGELLRLSSASLSLFFAVLLACRLFWRHAPLWLRMTLGVVAAFFALSFSLKLAGVAGAREAVVLADEAAVKSGDADDNVTLFTLHRGAEVEIGTEKETWVQVRLSDGKKGWMKRESLVFVEGG